MTHKFEALIYAILFTFWSVRLYYKLYDKKIRKYILSIGILIVFWMLIRMTKGVVETTLLERMSWYLYYIPLIFIPSISISPLLGSNILVIKLNNVLFPCPEEPTIAIFLFGSNSKLKSFNILSSSGYEK